MLETMLETCGGTSADVTKINDGGVIEAPNHNCMRRWIPSLLTFVLCLTSIAIDSPSFLAKKSTPTSARVALLTSVKPDQ